jgi:hypothetical protein
VYTPGLRRLIHSGLTVLAILAGWTIWFGLTGLACALLVLGRPRPRVQRKVILTDVDSVQLLPSCIVIVKGWSRQIVYSDELSQPAYRALRAGLKSHMSRARRQTLKKDPSLIRRSR